MLETIGILVETAARVFAAHTGFYVGEPGLLGVAALCVSLAASLAMLTALFAAGEAALKWLGRVRRLAGLLALARERGGK